MFIKPAFWNNALPKNSQKGRLNLRSRGKDKGYIMVMACGTSRQVNSHSRNDANEWVYWSCPSNVLNIEKNISGHPWCEAGWISYNSNIGIIIRIF
ncbi:hypothetical protein OPV22_010081 [Ensete ventricosum]|uniref:Uncharacterized protein n=1 Tax=Ensete ventricosum TaxID=4639 RepID=A0AAV8RIE3_ENSVE|nr:hypothetical protein OPV22_010081 [Ensete ventricosum]